MDLPRKPPEAGARELHWNYASTPNGPKGHWFGYLWGVPYEVECHGKERSKPCLRILTGGELSCFKCEQGLLPKRQAYVPVVRESDGKPCMVIVQECGFDFFRGLHWKCRVLISRGPAADDSAIVSRATDQREWRTSLRGLERQANLTRTLLTVWKLPELVAWMNRTQRPSDSPVSLPAPAPAAAPVPDDDPGDDAITRELKAVMRRNPQRHPAGPGVIGESLNGKHHGGE